MKIIYLQIIYILFSCLPTVLYGQSNAKISEQVNTLSEECWRLREKDSDSSLILGIRALELAEKHGLTEKIPQISNYVGVVYGHYLYKNEESIPYFHKAMTISILNKDSLQLAFAHNNLGDVYLISGNIPLALQYGEISLEMFKSLKNKAGEAYGYINLGKVYREKKELRKSLKYFKIATLIRKELNASPRMASVLYDQAKTYQELGVIDTAMNYYYQSLNSSYDTQNLRYVAMSLNGIADINYSRKEYDKAYHNYKRALDWNEKGNHKFGTIDSYIGLALVNAQRNERKEGEYLLNEALSLALKLGFSSQAIKAYNSYIEFYKILDDYDNVMHSYEIFLEQYDSILSVQQFEIVTEMERKFTAQQDLVKIEQELKTNNLLRLRLVLIIVLMIIILIVLVWQYISHRNMNIKLEKINKTKDKLFSLISHDLRNPFNSLLSFSELLQSKIDEEDFEQTHIISGYIKKASEEGLNLVTNLLHWSLSQSGRIQFNPILTNCSDLFKELEELFRIEVEKYKVSLEFDNQIKDKISADPSILKIVLVNLITNALKYTEEKGIIQVIANIDNNMVKIRVQDSGIGMSKETVDKLFAKGNFVKSKKGLREEKGSGLGLSIINDLIEIHKGKIKVSSKEGKGSSFEIEFPTTFSS
jgi:signal transduction histidine kinase